MNLLHSAQGHDDSAFARLVIDSRMARCWRLSPACKTPLTMTGSMLAHLAYVLIGAHKWLDAGASRRSLPPDLSSALSRLARDDSLWYIPLLLTPSHCPLLRDHSPAILHVDLVANDYKGKVFWISGVGLDKELVAPRVEAAARTSAASE